jgi:hypothetical protein
LGLSTVVITPTIFKWLCFDSLSRFFAEAYNVQLNTRFQGKWTEYQKQAQDASDMVFMSGVGIVYNPLAQPAMPDVMVAAGNTLAESLFVQTTWVDSTGHESQPSPINGQLLGNFSTAMVTPGAQAGSIPATAVGWNIYAGTANSTLYLQNSTPLPLTANWVLPAQGLASGRLPGSGQQPNFYVALTRPVRRG